MKSFSIVLMIFACIIGNSQDVIVKMDGGKLQCAVKEITTEVVKYSPENYQSELTFSIPVTDVFEVQYKNGTTVFFGGKAPKLESIKSPEASEKSYSQYDSLMKQSRSNKAFGVTSAICGPIIFISGTALLVLGVQATDKLDIAIGTMGMISGTIFIILAPVYIIKSKEQKDVAQRYKPAAYIQPLPVINFAGANKYYGAGVRITF